MEEQEEGELLAQAEEREEEYENEGELPFAYAVVHALNVAVQVLLKRNPTLERTEEKKKQKMGEEEVKEKMSMEVSSTLFPGGGGVCIVVMWRSRYC